MSCGSWGRQRFPNSVVYYYTLSYSLELNRNPPAFDAIIPWLPGLLTFSPTIYIYTLGLELIIKNMRIYSSKYVFMGLEENEFHF